MFTKIIISSKMDLSLRSLVVPPAQLPRMQPFAASQSGLLVLKSQMRVLSCCTAEGKDHEAANDSTLAQDSIAASWLQPEGLSDQSFGWTFENSQDHHDSKAGWVKVGGIAILAVGFALGAQALYLKHENKTSVVGLPIIEQILSSSKETKSAEAQGDQNTNKGNESKQLQSGVTNSDTQQKGISADPATGIPKPGGRVVVRAPVDHMQEQILAALQALKVVEAGYQAGDICTRRDYARWLITASARLSRSPAHKVFPAMYIEGVSKLAYADVLPEDEDFACIQGLAEAGLISSRLLSDATTDEADDDNLFFSPDSPLTRQDLITWKIALERKPPLPFVGSSLAAKKALQELSGFIDIDKIRQDACPALLADVKAGERGIIALAFGYTRRFQPEKPVTKAQAAVALATGEAWELVGEELARLEAESIAEAAVAAELALETKAQQEVAAAFNELLQAEKAKQQEAASVMERLQTQLEEIQAEREEEKYALLKDRAEIDCEKEILSNMKHDVEQQALLLSSAKLEASFQREHVDKLRAEAEEEKDKINKIRAELEVEKHALTLARTWAEEEARRALAHSKLLEEVRKRWEYGGVQVHVDKELDDMNIPGPSWHYSKGFERQSSLLRGLVAKSNDFVQQLKGALLRFFYSVVLFCQGIKQRSAEFAGEFNEKIHEAKSKLSKSFARGVSGIKQTLPSVTGLTAIVRDSTSKAVAECKGGAERLMEKLKVS